MSQDIEDTPNPRSGFGVFAFAGVWGVGPGGRPMDTIGELVPV